MRKDERYMQKNTENNETFQNSPKSLSIRRGRSKDSIKMMSHVCEHSKDDCIFTVCSQTQPLQVSIDLSECQNVLISVGSFM